jgi:hypothetical protein
LANAAGYQIVSLRKPDVDGVYPRDFGRHDIETILRVRAYSMTSPERLYCLMRAVEYVCENQIPGSIVECGVWKGGSMMAAALTLTRIGVSDRDLFLFDTFQGMCEPSAADGEWEKKVWSENQASDHNNWAYSPLDEVKRNVRSTGYPESRIHYVQGKVEDTLPNSAPEQISILRLDTDWYESTKHELIHLYPRLSRGGVLIIDDYAVFQGARKATDEYIRENGICLLLNRIDTDSRIAVKP